jgi:hypothetical protein
VSKIAFLTPLFSEVMASKIRKKSSQEEFASVEINMVFVGGYFRKNFKSRY